MTDASDASASDDGPYADWERLYWRQVRIVTIVLGATLGVALLATVVTLVAAPLDTTISYYRRSGQLSMLALVVPPLPLVGLLVKIRRPPKGRVPRGERVFVWIVLWPFVLVLGGGQLYLCGQFLMAGGVLGS